MITIFTPTYNRAYILEHLYNSLIVQTDKNFEWIIVDDGSCDDTESLVNGWISENKLNIVYHKQDNQGKHIAINTGVSLAKGELFFIVDSDDSLTEDAVEKIRRHWKKYGYGNENVSGILSYRKFHDGRIVGNKMPEQVEFCTLRDSYHKYASKGDKVVIYRTDIIKQFPYPKFEGENFLGESYVFNQIDDLYTMSVMNDAVYWFAYQEDGLSQDFRKLYRNNPNGFYLLYEQECKYLTGFKAHLKNGAHLDSLSFCLKKNIFQGPDLFYRLLALPLGLYLYIKIFVFQVSDVRPYTDGENE